MALAGPRLWGRASEGASLAARASPRVCSPTRPAPCSSCTICPNSGGGEADKGSREKKGGSGAAPGGLRMYWEHWRFRMGQRGAAPGRASPPTGSPRHGVWTECRPHGGSAGDGVRVQTGAANRQAGPSGPPAPSDAVVALARWTPDSPQAARRQTRAAASSSRRTAPWAIVPVVEPRTAAPGGSGHRSPAPRAGDSAWSPAPRGRDRRVAVPSASSETKARVQPLRGCAPCLGAVFHVRGVYKE